MPTTDESVLSGWEGMLHVVSWDIWYINVQWPRQNGNLSGLDGTSVSLDMR